MKTMKRSIQIMCFSMMLVFGGIHISANDAYACESTTTKDWIPGQDCAGEGNRCIICESSPLPGGPGGPVHEADQP
ncbi:hypothetical protein QA596_04000 [Balneolales bacterium ANBcel1]|nr:hypothetical protein [Balneolales bacterium ANBcel1]